MGRIVKYKLVLIHTEEWTFLCKEDVAQFDVREAPYEEVLELKKDIDFYNETRLDGEPSAFLLVEATPSDIQALMTETRARRLESLRRPKQDWPNFVDLVNPTGPAE